MEAKITREQAFKTIEMIKECRKLLERYQSQMIDESKEIDRSIIFEIYDKDTKVMEILRENNKFLSNRTMNSICHWGDIAILKFKALTDKEILGHRNVGVKTLNEINQWRKNIMFV